MKIDILTIFPEMCEDFLSRSIIGRARQSGLVDISCVDIRDYSTDKHRKTDDTPYGGGMGMVMTAQPIYDAFRACAKNDKPYVVYSQNGFCLGRENSGSPDETSPVHFT